MLVSPYVIAASTTGPSHRRAGGPCEDAFAFRVDRDRVVAAVADGLGSALCGGLGAALAVSAALEAALSDGSPAAGLVGARVALEGAAARTVQPLSDFACTLLVCVAAAGEVSAGHVGDGAAVIECGGRYEVLSPPGESEYLDEVVPLTADAWEGEVRVTQRRAAAFALFTDGCQRAALRRGSGWCAHPGWWGPIFGHARAAGDAVDLERLLASPRLSEHSDDDKTLLVAVLE